MSDERGDRTFAYLLDRMEHAGQQEFPAEHHYGEARRDVFDYVIRLRTKVREAEMRERARLKNHLAQVAALREAAERLLRALPVAAEIIERGAHRVDFTVREWRKLEAARAALRAALREER